MLDRESDFLTDVDALGWKFRLVMNQAEPKRSMTWATPESHYLTPQQFNTLPTAKCSHTWVK